jgi:hypothetical protein
LPLPAQLGDELRRLLEHLQRLLQVDDVNAVALAEDVFLHLGIPALGLMPEVDSRFEQFLHGDSCQWSSLVDCIRVVDCRLARIYPACGEICKTSPGAVSSPGLKICSPKTAFN